MNELVKNTLDSIPKSKPDAKRIIGLVKEGSRVTGYKLSDESFIDTADAVSRAKRGEIAGVAIAHRGDTAYLKSIPNRDENDNLNHLPSFSPKN